jgi:hypothetical protein
MGVHIRKIVISQNSLRNVQFEARDNFRPVDKCAIEYSVGKENVMNFPSTS